MSQPLKSHNVSRSFNKENYWTQSYEVWTEGVTEGLEFLYRPGSLFINSLLTSDDDE